MNEEHLGRDTLPLPSEEVNNTIQEETAPCNALFRYALHDRVRVHGRGETVYVVVRRRFEEGMDGDFVQYVLVEEANLDAHGCYVAYRTDYEPDLQAVEASP